MLRPVNERREKKPKLILAGIISQSAAHQTLGEKS
jgi:hypothetical protein